jgi:exodeoxyribonuclease-1
MSEALAREASLYEMMKTLNEHYAMLEPTVHVGFNSIQFDEEMLRRSLWQNLFQPYATQFHGHCRADVLKIAYVIHALRPRCFNTVLNDKGKPSFTLQDLARANGIVTRNAHDAAGDTHATIQVLQMLNNVANPIVKACLALALKSTAQRVICTSEVFAEVRSYFGRTSIIPLVRVCGAESATEFVSFDLNCDPRQYLDLDQASLCDVMLGKRGPRALSFVKTNRGSCILPLDHDLLTGVFSASQLQGFKERARWICDARSFSRSVTQAAELRTAAYEPAEYLEHRIYEGFTSRADSSVLAQFHAAKPEHKWCFVEQLQDDRLQQLAERLIWEEWPDALPIRERTRIGKDLAHRLTTDDPVPWTTVHSARRDALQLMQAADDQERAILSDFLAYLNWVEAGWDGLPDAAE